MKLDLPIGNSFLFTPEFTFKKGMELYLKRLGGVNSI